MTDREERIEYLFHKLGLKLKFLMEYMEWTKLPKANRKNLKRMGDIFGVKMRWYHLSHFFRKKLTKVIKGNN